MSAPAPGLDGLRRRIDAIDDRLHDLLIERSGVVEEIAQIKRQSNAHWYRPGREAEVLRRIVARHRGPFSKPSLVRLWREIQGAGIRQQIDFRAAALRGPDGSGSWELAHDHFGASVPLQLFASAGQVVACVAEGKASVGILPLPMPEDPNPWWTLLARNVEFGLRVVTRLPFAAGSASSEGLVIARAEFETTGRDRTLLVIETTEPLSRAKLHAAMEAGQLPPAILASDPATARAGRSLHLADVRGAVDPAEERVTRCFARLSPIFARVARLGLYAEPLTREELAP
ncbi:MAG: chorismate mutase [Alphaproteobacteria bacterium]|nr:chorismate mutase [Alphaproteobacteria bacterium]